MEKVALIEFGNSHDEVVYPQYLFLKESSDFEPVLFFSEALKNRLFGYPEEELHFISAEPRARDFRNLHRTLRRLGIKKVVINTASGKKVRNFLWSSASLNFECYGVLHNLRKLEKSTTQSLISLRLKNYFLLADYLKEKAQLLKPKLAFESFKALCLPAPSISANSQKPADETWIVVPGQVEYKRRDYLSLLESLEDIELDPRLRFILLGKSKHSHGNGPELKREIHQRKLEKHFIMWDDFVPNDEFQTYLAQADFVLPLIHQGHESAALYSKQISGAWNMAFAYRVPLLMDAYWSAFPEFKGAAQFYQAHELKEIWSILEKYKSGQYYQSTFWEKSHQAKAYLNFLKK